MLDIDLFHASQAVSWKSQEEDFPYFMEPEEVDYLTVQVDEGVFSPKHNRGWEYFLPMIPSVKGKNVLEMGCGHGIISLFLAREANYVVSTDINERAVKTVMTNAEYNRFDNIGGVVSNVFSGLARKQQFDLMFWNSPWGDVPRKYMAKMPPEEFGMFDAGYESIKRYLQEGKHHLSLDGLQILGFGEFDGPNPEIRQAVADSGLPYYVHTGTFMPGEKKDDSPVDFTMKTYYLAKNSEVLYCVDRFLRVNASPNTE